MNYVFYYEYEVVVLSGNESETRCGITTAHDYPEAVQNILDYYGKRTLISLRIEEWDSQGCLEISKECLQQLREDRT